MHLDASWRTSRGAVLRPPVMKERAVVLGEIPTATGVGCDERDACIHAFCAGMDDAMLRGSKRAYQVVSQAARQAP